MGAIVVARIYYPRTTESYSYDYLSITGATTPIMPPGTSFGFSTFNRFYVNVGNIPAVSYISLVFKVILIAYSLYYPTSGTAEVNATSQSDYTVVEYTPSFKLQSEQMQLSSLSYLAIIAVAVWVAVYAMDPKNYLEMRGWLK
jgi:hypothetical protein